LGPKVSLLTNTRLPLRRHSVVDSSNAPGFTHFRHTVLKYVDVYRCSDGGVLVGHRHNRPGPDNSARAPYMQPFPTVAGARHDQLCMEERARPHAGVPCFVVPWALQSMDTHTRRSQPLGYELTGRGLMQYARSHSCRSSTFSRPSYLAPSRLFASVPPCSVSNRWPPHRHVVLQVHERAAGVPGVV